MQQYYIKDNLEDELILKDNLFHYLKNVLRVRSGNEIILFNGKQKAKYSITDLSIDKIVVRKEEKIDVNIDGLKVDLAVGLLKKSNIELVIQKCVELGVNDIYLSEFTNNVVRFKEKDVQKKLNRYNEIAISACEQSKKDSISHVKYEKKLDFSEYEDVYVLYESEDINNTLYKRLHKNISKNILLIIGPEGGFTKEEIIRFLDNEKVKIVSLGKNILRAETAAILSVGLAINIINEEG